MRHRTSPFAFRADPVVPEAASAHTEQRVRLGQRGVGTSSFEELFDDYRVAIAMMIFYPIWDKVIGGSDRSYWWPKMQCLCDAYEDLNCRELVG